MRTHFVTHASLYHESGKDQILSDPWYDAPAYLNQWHVYPTPADDSWVSKANVLLISHGHEDHLNLDTLKRADHSAELIYPRQPDGDATPFFKDVLGFENYRELVAHKAHVTPGGTKVTAVPVGHDCIYVLEDGDHIVANVNDALHSVPAPLIERVTSWMKTRWSHFDQLWCGFGGASYFPNCFHHPSKDNEGIARVREVLFARNFCLITARLAPKVAVPFAADFVLKHESLKWINDTRFGREAMPGLFEELFPEAAKTTKVLPIEPGQWLEEDGSVTGEPAGGSQPEFVPYRGIGKSIDEVMDGFVGLLSKNLERKALPAECLPLAIEVNTDTETHHLQVSDEGGTQVAKRLGGAPADPAIRGVIGADNVDYLLQTEWHSDVVVIGYGMEFFLAERVRPTPGIVNALGDVVTHYPKVKTALMKQPLRTLAWIRDNHQARFAIARKIGGGGQSEFQDVDQGAWLHEKPSKLAETLGIPARFVTA